MNRLWVRFSLSFVMIALLGPVILATIGFLTVQTGVLRLFIRSEMTAPGSLTDQLAEYYQQQGSWEGVTDLIASYDRSLPADLTLVFVDEAQKPIYGTDTTQGQGSAEQLISIVVDGRARGYLSLVQRSIANLPFPRPDRPLVLNQVSNVLLAFAVITAVLGLSAGLFAGRTLVTPLAQLADTARRLGKHDFTARAIVKGSSELREVAHAFNEMAHDLEQAETLRRNLVADVAHELRTPLTVLQANLQALLDDIYPLEKAEIEKLLDQTALLNRLVDELRELSQAEARQLRLQLTTLDMHDLIAQVVETFQSTAKTQGIDIRAHLPGEDMLLQGDRGRLQQVLNNLIQNAITHTPAPGTISIRLSRHEYGIQIAVQDSGDGIPAEHLAHVFDRFYRVDRSRSRETGGTGLGLAIARAIVELHGGKISVESAGQPGSGATFTILLPKLMPEQ